MTSLTMSEASPEIFVKVVQCKIPFEVLSSDDSSLLF